MGTLIDNRNGSNQGPARNGAAPASPFGPDPTAASPDQLSPDLSERQINMIAFSAVVGTGLFINTGQIIKEAGPGGALLGYFLGAMIYWSVISSLGEFSAVHPVEGVLIELPSRFLGNHIGFAVGWLYWACYAIILPTQIVKLIDIINFSYAYGRETTSSELFGWGFAHSRVGWIILFWVLILLVNLLPVKLYGKMEAVIGYSKFLVVCGLILLMLIIAGRNARSGKTNQPFTASWYWPNKAFIDTYQLGEREYTGSTGCLLLVLKTSSTALFSYVGMEVIAVAIGEAKDNTDSKSPESIKVGTRKIYMRVIALYLATILAVSFAVASSNPALSENKRSAASPFIIAVVEAGIPALPHILNAFFAFSGFTAAVNSVYVSSRTLRSLAVREMVPGFIRSRVLRNLRMKNFRGVPYTAIITSWFVGLLAILGIWAEPGEVFKKLSINAVISAQIVNFFICLSYLRYYFQNLPFLEQQTTEADLHRANNKRYAYKSHLQPVRAGLGLVGCSVVIITNGLSAILKKPVDVVGVVASYISVVIFLALALGYAFITDDVKVDMFRTHDELKFRVSDPDGDRRGDFPLDTSKGFRWNLGALWKWFLVYL